MKKGKASGNQNIKMTSVLLRLISTDYGPVRACNHNPKTDKIVLIPNPLSKILKVTDFSKNGPANN